MKILHGTWIPSSSDEFIQGGDFCLWVETDTPELQQRPAKDSHPQQLGKPKLWAFLYNELGIGTSDPKGSQLVTKYFVLPSTKTEPLPSLELSRYLETEPPEPTTWKTWSIDCYRIDSIIKTINEIHFWCLYHATEVQIGSDLLFWYHYSQSFQEVIRKDRYIPALKYREKITPKSKSKKAPPSHEIYPGWEIISEAYEAKIHQYMEYL
jgi:hypothetical protein